LECARIRHHSKDSNEVVKESLCKENIEPIAEARLDFIKRIEDRQEKIHEKFNKSSGNNKTHSKIKSGDLSLKNTSKGSSIIRKIEELIYNSPSQDDSDEISISRCKKPVIGSDQKMSPNLLKITQKQPKVDEFMNDMIRRTKFLRNVNIELDRVSCESTSQNGCTKEKKPYDSLTRARIIEKRGSNKDWHSSSKTQFSDRDSSQYLLMPRYKVEDNQYQLTFGVRNQDKHKKKRMSFLKNAKPKNNAHYSKKTHFSSSPQRTTRKKRKKYNPEYIEKIYSRASYINESKILLKNKYKEIEDQQIKKVCTFKPDISKTVNCYPQEKSFADRQKEWIDNRDNNIEFAKTIVKISTPRHSFKPNLYNPRLRSEDRLK